MSEELDDEDPLGQFETAIEAANYEIAAAVLRRCTRLRGDGLEWLADLFKSEGADYHRQVASMVRRLRGRPRLPAPSTNPEDALLAALQSNNCDGVAKALETLKTIGPAEIMLLADAFDPEPRLSGRLPYRVVTKYRKPGRPKTPTDVKRTQYALAHSQLRKEINVEGHNRKEALYRTAAAHDISEGTARRRSGRGKRLWLQPRR